MKKITLLLIGIFLMGITTLTAQTLVINEFMADNSETIPDPSGSYDDWIEVFNYGNTPVDIGGLYITDDFADPTKYQIPEGNDSTIIQPQGFLLIWADDDTEQGVLHVGIKLSKSGEEIAFLKPDGITFLDSVSFGQQTSDVSYGRQPNGASNWTFFDDPTPGWSNTTTGVFVSDNVSFKIYPNPAGKTTTMHFPFTGEKNIRICDLNGNLVFEQKVSTSQCTIHCESFSKGQYIVSVEKIASTLVQKQKLVIQ